MPAAGGALLVSNHSGGCSLRTSSSSRPEFYKQFGFDRSAVHARATTACSRAARRSAASRRCHRGQQGERGRRAALRRRGAGVPRRGLRLVPADHVPPTSSISAAAPAMSARRSNAGVPIVPMVSIGAQETQMFLARGDSIARTLGLTKARMEILPDQHRLPIRPFGPLPAEPPVAVQDRHPGPRPHRRRREVRRGPRHRRGRPPRQGGDADGAGRTGPEAPVPGNRLSDVADPLGLLSTLWRRG